MEKLNKKFLTKAKRFTIYNKVSVLNVKFKSEMLFKNQRRN